MRKHLPPILKLKAQQQRVLRKINSTRAMAGTATPSNLGEPEKPTQNVSTDSIKLAIDQDVDSTIGSAVESVTTKPTVAVCCCGFAPRSLKYTNHVLQKNIIDQLKTSFNVDVYLYSFLSKNNLHESPNSNEHGIAVDNEDIDLLENAVTQTIYQEDIASEVKRIIADNKIKLRDIAIINFIRGLLMEQKSFQMICESSKKYDSIVYVHPDMFFAKPISLKEVFDTINNKNCIYTTHFNDWNGYGTGFYIGSPKAIGCVASQINNLPTNLAKIEPERLLKKTIENMKLSRYKSSMFHFKVRASGTPDVYYQLLKKYTTTKEYMGTLAQFKKVTKGLGGSDTSEHRRSSNSKDDTYIKRSRKHSRDVKSGKGGSSKLETTSNPKSKRHHKRRSCPG